PLLIYSIGCRINAACLQAEQHLSGSGESCGWARRANTKGTKATAEVTETIAFAGFSFFSPPIAYCGSRDVFPILDSFKIDFPCCLVGASGCSCQIGTVCGYTEHAATGGHDAIAYMGGPRMEDLYVRR